MPLTCIKCLFDELRSGGLRQVNAHSRVQFMEGRRAGDFHLTTAPQLAVTSRGDALELRPDGSWIAANVIALETLADAVAPQAERAKSLKMDMSGLSELDTLGAWLLEKLSRRVASANHPVEVVGVSENYAGLIEEVRHVNRHNPPPPKARNPVIVKVEEIGRSAWGSREDVAVFLQMLGSLCVALLGIIRKPRSLRLTSLVYQLYRVGWQAIPIILLITFLIGGIIAQQGIFHFRKFGADAYVVDMVGILVLREIGVLIVSIMVAGRSGSAYTAELGSMKMREEIDALRTMGFDPVEVLILPRVLALVCALPILTFLGSMSALYGGGLVAWLYGGMSPEIFIARMQRSHLGDPFRGRHDQGAIHGARHRHRRLQRRSACQGQRRIARPADHNIRGEVDLPGHRSGWRYSPSSSPRSGCERMDRIGRAIGNFGERSHGRIRQEDRARSPVARSPPWRNPRPGRRVGRRKIGSVANDHRPHSANARPTSRSWAWSSTRPIRGNSARSGGAGASCFSRARLFSSLTVRQNMQFPMRENLGISERCWTRWRRPSWKWSALRRTTATNFPRSCPAA